LVVLSWVEPPTGAAHGPPEPASRLPLIPVAVVVFGTVEDAERYCGQLI
jgi:hypothetical protein